MKRCITNEPFFAVAKNGRSKDFLILQHAKDWVERHADDIEEEKAKPKAKLIGANGNIFNLAGIAGRVLKRDGQWNKAKEMYQRITQTAHSYDEALAIIMEYVDVY